MNAFSRPGTWRLGLTILATGVLLTGCTVLRPRDARGPDADAIEAANKISLVSERLRVLKQIARRKDLSQANQIYLVDSICRAGPGGLQARPLITLLKNPACTPKTRQRISDQLQLITWSDERRRVAEALMETSPDRTPDE